MRDSEVSSLHVIVHAISEVVLFGTHALALWVLRLKHRANWLEVSLKSCAIHWNVRHSEGMLGEATKRSSIRVVVERINRRGVEKHLGSVAVGWSRWRRRGSPVWQFRLSVFFTMWTV
jgi:hypothetical protein